MVTGWVFVRVFIPQDGGWAVDNLADAGSGANQEILQSVFLGSVFTLSLVGMVLYLWITGLGRSYRYQGPVSICVGGQRVPARVSFWPIF